MQVNKQGLSKRLAIVLALVTVVALLLTGTFAWYATASKENVFSGKPMVPPILHDDFDAATGQKEVFAENTGDGDIYVRVKLNELLDLTSDQRPAGEKEDLDWVTHTPAYGEPKVDQWYHNEDCHNTNAAGDKFHDYFTIGWGGQKYYRPATRGQSGVAVNDLTDYGAWTPAQRNDEGIKQTPVGDIICIDYYLSGNMPATWVGWVYDLDGYAYWSAPLKPGGATGLLLNRVDKDEILDEYSYYYVIDVILEAVNNDDLPMWTAGAVSVVDGTTTYQQASADGIALLNKIKTP